MAKGFYYKVKMADLELTDAQVKKVRSYVRDKVRSVAAVDSGRFYDSIKTLWSAENQTLMVYSKLWYAGYIEGGNPLYNYHKNKIGNALRSMGLKTGPLKFF